MGIFVVKSNRMCDFLFFLCHNFYYWEDLPPTYHFVSLEHATQVKLASRVFLIGQGQFSLIYKAIQGLF